jgi:hypothetical protein
MYLDLQCHSCRTITRIQKEKDAISHSYCGGCGRPHNADTCSCGAWIAHESDLHRYRNCTACGSPNLTRGVKTNRVSNLYEGMVTMVAAPLVLIYLMHYWPKCWIFTLNKVFSDIFNSMIKTIFPKHAEAVLVGYVVILVPILFCLPVLSSYLYGLLFGSRGQHLVLNDDGFSEYTAYAIERYPDQNKEGIHLRRKIRQALKKCHSSFRLRYTKWKATRSEPVTNSESEDMSSCNQ